MAHTADQVPARRREIRYRLLLCILSGVMLGLSFPPSPFGVLACFGLVPLLIVLADIDGIWRGLRYSYVAFLVFHIITLNWTGGYSHGHDAYMMIAGAATMIAHPLFYFIPMALYLYVRTRLGGPAALVVFPFAWVGYEFSHALTEWSFPWLTLGNSQSYDLARMQFISFTGVYGLSFWIVIVNIAAYLLYSGLAQRKILPWSAASIGLVLLILAVYELPAVYGNIVLSHAPQREESPAQRGEKEFIVGAIQPNFDPWEKWTKSEKEIVDAYLRLSHALLHASPGRAPDLILWPETAIPFYVLSPGLHPMLNDPYLRLGIAQLGVPVLTGLPHMVLYRDSAEAPPSAKRLRRTGQRYDSFNAAALLEPGSDSAQWYGKMKMVPFAERVPYADALSFVKFLQWDVGIGGWQLGPDTTIFVETRTGARFGTIICYESVYPDFVAAFVRKGAEFIALITIDSWWGRMSGAFQHEQFARFRAVENRRWIARCALGGISCCIDPYGRVYDTTELFTQSTPRFAIGRRTDQTFYTLHGDWLGQICGLVAALFCAAALGQATKNKMRARLWESST